MNNVAIIAARGGSKGIKHKNLINFCGKPLIAWSIDICLNTPEILDVWVTTDCEKIKNISLEFGAKVIIRPKNLSNDLIMPDAAWLHAFEEIFNSTTIDIDKIIALQATSPLRLSGDLSRGIMEFEEKGYDSMFSASKIEDLLFWKFDNKSQLISINYDWQNRIRRQDTGEQFVENGSFYIFKPFILKQSTNRLGGKIGMSILEFWQTFEIDEEKDIEFCEVLMKNYVLSGSKLNQD